MYEIHLRTWNSGINVAIIYKSNDLKECEEFSEKWNDTTSVLYNKKCVRDEYKFFADIYDVKNDKYVYGL